MNEHKNWQMSPVQCHFLSLIFTLFHSDMIMTGAFLAKIKYNEYMTGKCYEITFFLDLFHLC